MPVGSGNGDVLAQVYVLDRVEELDPFGHGALERFPAGDQAHAAGALVDDGGGDGVAEIIFAGGAPAVDEAGAAHVAIGDLVAAEVDGVVAAEIGINPLVELPVAGIRGRFGITLPKKW